MVNAPASPVQGEPVVSHESLHTTFTGVVHPLSTPDAQVHQYRGIKYASIPARFRQSKLCTSYPALTDASRFGPICPQPKHGGIDVELFGLTPDAVPHQALKQDEFECLNLNITVPADATSTSHLPVMLWIHGGGVRGSGSHWLYDGGAFVQKSMQIGKPVILVTINYRLGLLGFACSAPLREDNESSGDQGVGNYGLRDQRRAMEWVHKYISAFGGDPSNVTLFGESSGATDILCHLNSADNETLPLFHRAIIQSASMDLDIPAVHSAGWQLGKMMSSLQVHSVGDMRVVPVEKLIGLNYTIRATDDGVFFRPGWRQALYPEQLYTVEPSRPVSHRRVHDHLDVPELEVLAQHSHPHHHSHSHARSASRSRSPYHIHHKTRQPLIIGDCGVESILWQLPASLWTSAGAVKRIRAVCQSLAKSTALLRAYDINSYTPADELPERILELINDARFAWPTERIARAAKHERGGHGVWRYVFDQESPARGIPHHAVDLMYLFDTVPLPSLAPASPPEAFDVSPEISHPCTPPTPDMIYCSDSSSDDDGRVSPDFGFGGVDDEWGVPVVDEYAYSRVRDAIQSRWLAFAYGEVPWNEDKVFVFGPEGETGERSMSIFTGRRRVQAWKDAFEPLGMQVVQKVGVELSNGPPLSSKTFY
ncbi:carboxylesterase [Panus rudis PR-1116 ss-1]|nr:carboxylesterase [Panus rudis PR-1116 ss-1]